MRSPGQIPQLVARRFDDERTLEEQLALVYSSLGSNQLFVNPERSTHNCSECSIAVDQRLAGLGAAVARGERLDAYADDDAGVAAELADPEVLAKLIDADETNPDLIALRDGRVTFEALIDAGRTTITAAVEALRSADFSRDTTEVEAAMRAVAELPAIRVMARHNARDYSIWEVANRLGHPRDAVELFQSKESDMWASVPTGFANDFDPRWLSPVAERSGVSASLRGRIEELQPGERAVLSFEGIDADGTKTCHLLNVVTPHRSAGADASIPQTFIVDGQSGEVYAADDFLRRWEDKLLVAELLPTGMRPRDAGSDRLFVDLVTDYKRTDLVLREAAVLRARAA